MDIIVYVLICLIVILGILGIIHVTYYNKLQNKKVRIDEAESVIDDCLRQRYDLIIRVSNIIKTTIDINAEYFKSFEALKNQKITNFDFDRKVHEAINLVEQLLSDNSSLEENRGVQDVLKELKETEEKLEAAKSFYNKYTTELNIIVRKFPSNITARIHKFVPKPFFDGKDLEDDIVDDFKV